MQTKHNTHNRNIIYSNNDRGCERNKPKQREVEYRTALRGIGYAL
jgi:hypothetical protein